MRTLQIGASTKELACDANFMKNLGQLMLASIQKLHKAHIEKTLRPKDFVDKIVCSLYLGQQFN